jgi:hypothetical protein
MCAIGRGPSKGCAERCFTGPDGYVPAYKRDLFDNAVTDYKQISRTNGH